jgi:hypothetical protein
MVSMCWHTPLIHVVTLTKSLVTSQVTETRALTKSLRLPSRRGGDQATYNLILRAPTILGKLLEKHLDHQDRLGDANRQE